MSGSAITFHFKTLWIRAMQKDKLLKIEAILRQVGGESAEKLVTAVEIDRLSGGKGLPHQTILDGLRPTLRSGGGAARVATPQRMFCSVFEDLLLATNTTDKKQGRIQRNSIQPMWDWLRSELMPELHEQKMEEVTNNILSGETGLAWMTTIQLQKSAGTSINDTIKQASESDADFATLCDRFGGAHVIADFVEMADCLETAEDLKALRDIFPRPIENVSAQDIAKFEEIYKDVVAYDAKLSKYAVLVLMSRFALPSEILPVLSILTSDPSDTVVDNDHIKLVGNLLVDDLKAVAGYFEGLDPSTANAAEFVENLNYFTRMVLDLQAANKLDTSGAWHKGMAAAQKTVTDYVADFIEKVPDAIFAAFPVDQSTGFGSDAPRAPILTQAPSMQATDRALDLARLFVECAYYCEEAGFTEAFRRAMPRLRECYDRYAADLITELGSGSPEALSHGKAFGQSFVGLASELLGEDEGAEVAARFDAAISGGLQNTKTATA